MSRPCHNRRFCATAALVLAVLGPSVATAQQSPPPQPAWPPPPVWPPPPAWPPPVEPEDDMEIESDGFQVPPGYHLETRHSKGLLIAGGVTFGASYFMAASAAAGAERNAEHNWLFVPAIGPWIALATHEDPCAPGRYDADAAVCFDLVPSLYLIDGIAQVTGAILLGAGLLSTRQVLVRNDVPRWVAPPAPAVSIAPAWFGPRMPGVSLSLVLDPQPASP